MMEVTLPYSGKTATIRRATGHDIVKAELLCDSGAEGKPMTFQLALLSRITMIEGKTLPLEDFLDQDSEDLIFLGKLELPKSKESPPAPSSQSPRSQDGDGET